MSTVRLCFTGLPASTLGDPSGLTVCSGLFGCSPRLTYRLPRREIRSAWPAAAASTAGSNRLSHLLDPRGSVRLGHPQPTAGRLVRGAALVGSRARWGPAVSRVQRVGVTRWQVIGKGGGGGEIMENK